MSNNPKIAASHLAIVKSLLVGLLVLAFPQAGFTETEDFGGSDFEFGGRRGDRTPPQCQVDFPSLTTSASFVSWNCEDDISDPSEIRTEFWIVRSDQQRPVLLQRFLGFPASLLIDETVLGGSFETSLPVSFRMVATDRAGNSALSSVLEIGFGIETEDDEEDTEDETGDDTDEEEETEDDTATDSQGELACALEITTEQIPSTETTTGLPSTQVTVSTLADFSQLSSGSTSLNAANVTASPCEIDSVCADNDQVDFSLSYISGSTNGTISISPGNISLSLTGTSGETTEGAPSSIDFDGSTVIDGRSAGVSLTCS